MVLVYLSSFGLIWLIASILVFAIASRKGKNPAAWLIYGILFGPFALLFLIRFTSRHVESGFRKCQACGHKNSSEVTRCTHCERPLPPRRPR
jgi:hypothetical protein